MRNRSILTPPERLAELSAAYDRAWRDIAMHGRFRNCAGSREWLAHIVIGLAEAGVAGDLAATAVARFVATVPQLPGAAAPAR